MSGLRRRHWHFLIILLVFSGGVAVYQALHPFMEGVDEDLHFNYVNFMRNENRLPDRLTFASNTMRQESGQPPLTYWVAARFLDLLNLPHYTDDVRVDLQALRNSWSYPRSDITPETRRRSDNHNVYYHEATAQALSHPEIIDLDRAARVTSLLFGVFAVIGCYGAAREVFARTEWVIVACALFALMPQFMYMNALLTNDISSTAFATLAIGQTLRLRRAGASPLRLVILGLLLGLCGLSKINGLVVAPGAALAIAFDARNRHVPVVRLLANETLVALAAAIVLGPWLLFGWLTSGDPLGTNTHVLFEGSLPSLGRFLAYLPTVYESYWGKMNAMEFSGVTYFLFTLLLSLSVIGYGAFALSHRGRFGRLSEATVQQAVILLSGPILALMLTVVWLLRLFSVAPAITSRLMYPAHAAIVILLTGGLSLLAQRLPHAAGAIRLYAVGLVIPAGLFLAPLSFAAVYAPPRTPPDLSGLHSVPIDYDHTIRFLGYKQRDPFVHQGEFHTFTLCWQILRAPARTAAFALKLFDTDGTAVGERTSVHGMGHYPAELWKVGDTFCDDVDVLITKPVQPAHSYNVVIVLLDDFTKAADWQATTPDGAAIAVPLITQVVAPAGVMAVENLTKTPIVFPNFAALAGYEIDRAPVPGATLNLDLAWDVTAPTPDNWLQFIHLVGPNTAISLADGIPRGGGYPTWAWSAGERIADRWQVTIPTSLAPGDYTLQIGFAMPNTRMPVTVNGVAPPDSAAPLLTFHVG